MDRTTTLFRNGLLLAALTILSLSPAQAQMGGDDCGAQAGSTLMAYGPDCLVNGEAFITGTPSGDAVVPPGFTTAFLLSRTNGLILEQVGPTPNFLVSTADVWRIHTLVFDPETFDPSSIDFGITTGFDLAAQFAQLGGPICADLSFAVYGSKTQDCDTLCEAYAAPLSMDSTTICLVDGQATLTAQLGGAHVVPPGFEAIYMLTRTNGLIIEQFSPTPSFTVNSVDVWRLHSFVYNPFTFDPSSIAMGQTTVFDLYPQLVQGGGAICADLSLDAAFVKTGECQTSCGAVAGGLHTEQPDLCLTDGQAEAVAQADGTAQVPDGYELVFLLAQQGLVLALDAGPAFMLNTLGAFSIHAFVYHPGTFDIDGVVAGETTLAAIHAQLQQGGGPVCGSLDMEGAAFHVSDCTPACEADAGAMLGGWEPLCLEEGMVTLSAVSFGDTVVPPGFTMGYLLSEGTGLLLMDWGSVPEFTVHAAGTYHIHAFVHDTTTWPEGLIDWGSTDVFTLNDALMQGGGPICAGLDVLGAAFQVLDCGPSCDAGQNTEIDICWDDDPFDLITRLEGNPCPEGLWTSPFAEVVDAMFDPASSAPGTYTYTVEGPDGEVYTSSLTINVYECPNNGPGQAALDAVHDASRLQLWPNPAEGFLYVDLPFTPGSGVHVELFDPSGRLVPMPVVRVAEQRLVLDVSTLSRGIWSIRVVDGSSRHLERFVR